MNIQKLMFGMLFAAMLNGMVMGEPATTGSTAGILTGLCELYALINSLLVAVVFILIVSAAIVYAGGQLLGAETRARAAVWATSMFIGALIGVLIFVIVPAILGIMMPGGLAACGASPSTSDPGDTTIII